MCPFVSTVSLTPDPRGHSPPKFLRGPPPLQPQLWTYSSRTPPTSPSPPSHGSGQPTPLLRENRTRSLSFCQRPQPRKNDGHDGGISHLCTGMESLNPCATPIGVKAGDVHTLSPIVSSEPSVRGPKTRTRSRGVVISEQRRSRREEHSTPNSTVDEECRHTPNSFI